jgi:hypothetical protein
MGNNKKIVAAISFVAVASFAAGAVWGQSAAKREPVITLLADVKWQPLDPNAGAAGPQAAVVFGDMKKKAPIGLLFKVPGGDGGEAGLHTHSSDFYGVSIAGSFHNWAEGQPEGPAITSGGFWMQPGKGVHNNSCDTKECIAFTYFPKGFDQQPAKAAPPAKKTP